MLRRIIVVSIVALTLAVGVSETFAKNAPRCTAERGQRFIDEARYDKAISEFTCVIGAAPADVEGYRGRIEAELRLGRYSDAAYDHNRVTGLLPVDPDARQKILDHYAARLAANPDDVAALTGASFANWWFFDYGAAIPMLEHLLELMPDDLYGTTFHGSNLMLSWIDPVAGAADLEQAIALAPANPHVRFIVADAYTYGATKDPERAFDEASLALDGGLDTPRIHAILAVSYQAFGDPAAAANEIATHIALATTEVVPTAPVGVGDTFSGPLVAGRAYEIPLSAVAGETVSIETSSTDFFDSIAVLLAPDGTPVVGSDDANDYFAAFEWIATETATYRVLVTTFDGASAGEVVVTRNGA